MCKYSMHVLQRLMDSLNPEVKQELKDNVWLKREVIVLLEYNVILNI